jgi:hypothetical protein
MTDAETLAAVLDAVRAYRFNHDDEKELQAGIAAAFTARGIEYAREVRLSTRDVPDFMVGAIAVEVKIAGSAAAVTRQLDRYAGHDRVRAVVLLTTCPGHQVIHGHLRQKPIATVLLRGNFP